MTSKHDYIKEAAYFIWLNRGKPEGQDLEIWDEATKIYELTQEVLKPVAKKSVAKKSTKKAIFFRRCGWWPGGTRALRGRERWPGVFGGGVAAGFPSRRPSGWHRGIRIRSVLLVRGRWTPAIRSRR